jgi:hypothetical protein
MDEIYERYEAYVRGCLETGDITHFKSHEDYVYMLEHVDKALGQEYLTLLLSQTAIPVETILSFCAANDAVGAPLKEEYDISGTTAFVSPSSLRYLYHAHLALTHFKQFTTTPAIVEIGGGYGGLCAAVGWIQQMYGIRAQSYAIVDLEAPSQLQELYLKSWPSPFPVSFHSATEYGSTVEGEDLYLISNYCFSELSNHNQKRYLMTLFPIVVHGFIAWNMIKPYDLGFDGQESEPEVPASGTNNFYVRF